MTDQQLELELRAWFRAEVPPSEAAPATLRGVIAAIPRQVGRPMLVITPRRRLALLVAAALVAVIVGGLLLAGSKLFNEVRPTQTPIASAEGSPGPNPTPTSDARRQGLPANAGMFSTLSQVHAVSDTVTWLVTGDAILRTEDAGATWLAVQPENWLSGWGSEGVADAETAFASTGDGSSISVTHDGGLSWTSHPLDGAHGFGAPNFTVRSSSEAFVTFVDPKRDNAPKGTGVVVFSTTDGGATWLGPTRGVQPHFDASANKLMPANGAFLVETAGKFDYKPFENWFNVSEDGGVTYTRYEFPTGTLAPKNRMKTVDAIIRGDDGHLLIAIAIGVDSPTSKIIPQSVWRNGQDPASWELVQELPSLGEYEVQFLSPTTWMLASGAPSEIRWTTDAGASWRTVIPSLSLSGVQQPAGVYFATTQTGWATEHCGFARLTPCSDDGRSPEILFVTQDGGATWRPVGLGQ